MTTCPGKESRFAALLPAGILLLCLSVLAHPAAAATNAVPTARATNVVAVRSATNTAATALPADAAKIVETAPTRPVCPCVTAMKQCADALAAHSPVPLRPATVAGMRETFGNGHCLALFFGLLLTARTIRGLGRVVVAFALGHLAMMMLATLNTLHPSRMLFGPAMALSVAAVGIADILYVRRVMYYAPLAWRPDRDSRWRLALTLGLFSGLSLTNSIIAICPTPVNAATLAWFNAGIAITFAIMLVAIAPILLLTWHFAQRTHRVVVEIGSWTLVLMGAVALTLRSGPLCRSILNFLL